MSNKKETWNKVLDSIEKNEHWDGINGLIKESIEISLFK